MTSMLCDKQLGGVVGVQNENKVEELIIDGEDHIQTMYLDKSEPFLQRKKIRRPYSTPIPGSRATMTSPSAVDPDAVISHTLKLQDWLNEKSIKNIQENSDLETKNTRKLYDDMLYVEDSFLKEMEDLVKYQQLLDLRKKELLHKRWTERVYQPIRRQVVSEANSPEFGELFQRKRQLYKEYLEHINKKGHVFLETFDPAEYYPMSLNPVRPGSITAQTKRLRDPLLSQQRSRCSEDRVIIQCQVGSQLTDSEIEQIRLPPLPLVPLGRHGTGAPSWVAMPMGDIESPVRLASRRRIRGRNNQSQIHFAKSFLAPTDFAKPISEELETNKANALDPVVPEMKTAQSFYPNLPEKTIDDVKKKDCYTASATPDVPSTVKPDITSGQLMFAYTEIGPCPNNVSTQVPLLLETSPVIKNQSVAVQTSC